MPESAARRGVRDVLRYALGFAVGAVVLLLLVGKRGDLAAAGHQLGHVNAVWLAAAVVAEAMSLWTFACLQHQVLRLAGALVRAVRGVTGHPRGSLGARIDRVLAPVDTVLARMREIPLSTRSTVGVVAIAAGAWFCDFLCLVCAFGTVHARIPWYGVLLAYGAAQVVGSVPVVPGGLGIVEGSLAVILAAYGAGRVPAVSAALAFRLVNYWLAIAVGWASFAVIAYHARRYGSGSSAQPLRAGVEPQHSEQEAG
jgi:uncharacterized membrane protein YbhN (UPF0104 family)